MKTFFWILVLWLPAVYAAAQDLEPDSLMRYSLSELDSLYTIQKKPKEQLPYALAMLQKGEKELDTKDTVFAKILFQIGNTSRKIQDYASAELYLTKAIDIWKKKMPVHAETAACLESMGTLLYFQRKNTEAESLWLEALSTRTEALGSKHFHNASNLMNLGLLYREMGEYNKANYYYLQARDIYKTSFSEEHRDYNENLNQIAVLYRIMGDYNKAEDYFLQALRTCKKIWGEEHSDYARICNNIGLTYRDLGEYQKAENYLLQSLEIRKKLLGEEHIDYAQTLHNVGVFYKDLGDYEKSKNFFFNALNIRKKTLGENHPDCASILNNIGEIYYRLGDYTEAENFLIQALNIRKQSLGQEHPRFAQTLDNMANLYRDAGNSEEAETHFFQALSIRKKVFGEEHLEYAQNLYGIGLFYLQRLDYKNSENYLQKAMTIYEKILGTTHINYVACLFGIGNLNIKMEDYTKAETYYSQIFNIETKNIKRNFIWLTEKGRAAYWQKEKAFYSDLNRFAALAADALPQSAALAYNGNLVAKSLLLESSRALDQAAQNSTDSTSIKIYADLKEKRRLIDHLTSTGTGKKEILDRYEAQADSLDRLLMQRLGEYAASKRRFQIDWHEVQNALKSEEAAVEFARYYDDRDSTHKYLALVLRPGYEYPRAVKLCTEKALQEIPAGRGFAELHRLVWDPIDSLLEGAKTVYYSPDGYLNNLAFGAFCGQGDEIEIIEKDKKRGSKANTTTTVTKTTNCVYLADRYTLHRLSTTRYLAEGLPDVRTEPNTLILGGIDYDNLPSVADTLQVRAEEWSWQESDYVAMRSSANRDRMDYLPGTLAELQNLQKSLKRQRWTVRAYSDLNASEHTVKAELEKQSPAVLHIATHGFAFPEADSEDKRAQAQNPLQRCGLLLAGANHTWTGNADTLLARTGEDGILTALEVSNLSLENTQLVVLSACETGLGKVEGTEGVFGLNRGFKLAGVPCIVVSLWAVPDKETGELMAAFYDELAKSQDPVQAFEQAQGDMRKKYRERPDLWAGFVLVR